MKKMLKTKLRKQKTRPGHPAKNARPTQGMFASEFTTEIAISVPTGTTAEPAFGPMTTTRAGKRSAVRATVNRGGEFLMGVIRTFCKETRVQGPEQGTPPLEAAKPADVIVHLPSLPGSQGFEEGEYPPSLSTYAYSGGLGGTNANGGDK